MSYQVNAGEWIRELVDGLAIYSTPPSTVEARAGEPATVEMFRELFVADGSNLKKAHFILLEYRPADEAGGAALFEDVKRHFSQLDLLFDIAALPDHVSIFIYKRGYVHLRLHLSINGIAPSVVLRLAMPKGAGGHAAKTKQTDAFLLRGRLQAPRFANMAVA